MQVRQLIWATALTFLVFTTGPASAGFIVTTGAGMAVSTANRSATFDSVVTGTSLANYTENGLRIAVNRNAFIGFDPSGGNGGFSGGFHYPDGGASGATLITTTDAVKYVALEFNFGSGASFSAVRYEARDSGVVIGTGAFTVTRGTVVGFRNDAGGFDQLFVGAYTNFDQAQTATNDSSQALALDNLRVQLNGAEGVVGTPVPPTLMIACGAFGVLGCGWLRRRLMGYTTSPAEPDDVLPSDDF